MNRAAQNKRRRHVLLSIPVAVFGLATACSSLPPDRLAATPATIAAAEVPDLPAIVTADDVERALAELVEPQAISITLVRTNQDDGTRTTETLTSNEDRSVYSVVVDHTEVGEAIYSQLEEAARQEAESDAEETMLPAWASLAGVAMEPLTYMVEPTGPESAIRWFRIGDVVRADQRQLESLALTWGDEFQDVDASGFGIAQPPPGVADKWAASSWSLDSRDFFPVGLGAELIGGSDQLITVGLLGGDEVFKATELSRTDTTVLFEVTPSNDSTLNYPVIVELDANLDVVSIDLRTGMAFEFLRNIDTSVIALPPTGERVNQADLDAWLGEATCQERDQFSVPELVSLDCPS